MSEEEFDYREAFLKANARNDYIAGEVEDLLRILMRGIASENPSANVGKAVEKLRWIIDLVMRCENLDARVILESAMEGISETDDDDELDRAFIGAAKDGLMFLIENSAHDGFARGRASKRRSNFMRSIEHIDRVREKKRSEWEAKR